jgi:hypothetical protein
MSLLEINITAKINGREFLAWLSDYELPSLSVNSGRWLMVVNGIGGLFHPVLLIFILYE